MSSLIITGLKTSRSSLRTIARRHTDPDSVVQRFLWYNTYLMRVRIALAKALADFAGPATF
jgi:hypothetical protein